MARRGDRARFRAEKHIVNSFLLIYDYGLHSYNLQKMIKEVMWFHDSGNVWIENGDGSIASFVKFVQ